MPTTTDLEALVDRDAALQVLHRYVDRVDALDLEGLRELFVDDATAELFGLVREGGDAIVRHLGRALGTFGATSHHVTNPIVTVDGDGASISASVYAWHLRPSSEWWHVWGRYVVEMRRTGAGWRIHHLGLVGIGGGPDGDPAERSLYTGHPDRAPGDANGGAVQTTRAADRRPGGGDTDGKAGYGPRR